MKRVLLFLSTFVIAVSFAGLVYTFVTGNPHAVKDLLVPQKARLEKAAVAGDADAQLKLARMAFLGEGMAKDEALGASWVKKAARGGSARARGLLGVLYMGGIGVTQNFEAAQAWLAQSYNAEGKELADRLAALESAMEKLPAEEREKQLQANYQSAANDIRSSFTKMLNETDQLAEQPQQQPETQMQPADAN